MEKRNMEEIIEELANEKKNYDEQIYKELKNDQAQGLADDSY